ncbi:MAG: hypothetical protein V4629_03130 [Pseudomonadota bacterium]
MKKLNKNFVEIIEHIKAATSIDISQISLVSNKPKTFFQVDQSKLSDFEKRMILDAEWRYKKFRIENNGFLGWALLAA